MGLMLEVPKYPELFQHVFSTRILLLLGLFTSGMMVITLPMFSLKIKNLKWKDNWYRYLFLLVALVLLVTLNVYGLALTILVYIFLNIGFYLAGIRF
jgi:CDP-diacylglycerol--serine O-phosphatidyltransferase